MLTTNQIKLFASLKQKKYREEHGKFLIEGFHLIEECLKSAHILEYIIISNDLDLQGYPAILEKISKTKTIVEPLPERSFNKLIDTEASQGIVGVVSKPSSQRSEAPGDLIIALDSVSDPGNLGTIIRTAYWFDVKTILLSKGSADPYNPKVIRSTQGGIFHTNIIEDADLKGKLIVYKNSGHNVFLFTLNADSSLSQILQSDESDKSDKSDKSKRSVIVFGSESHGISEELLNEDFTHVKIEGYSDCESLNVAIAAGIALYILKN